MGVGSNRRAPSLLDFLFRKQRTKHCYKSFRIIQKKVSEEEGEGGLGTIIIINQVGVLVT